MRIDAKLALPLCLILVLLPITAQGKKPEGEILNQRALSQVRTYCIDKSNLDASDLYLVNGFLKTESKPKHLLTKLPWKRVEDCRDDRPDAIATVEFVSLNSAEIRLGEVTGPRASVTDARDPETRIKVVLTVGDPSQKPFYQAQGIPLTSELDNPTPNDPPVHGGLVERQDAVYHVFWSLINDLQVLHLPAPK